MKLFDDIIRGERRRYPRVNDALKISYQTANDSLRPNCISKDISEGGLRFGLYQRLTAGTSLKICIFLQDYSDPLWVIGKIVWTRETPGGEYPYEAGIEFDFFDSTLRSRIRNHIQSIEKNQ